MITKDLSKQKASDADPKAVQQIDFFLLLSTKQKKLIFQKEL